MEAAQTNRDGLSVDTYTEHLEPDSIMPAQYHSAPADRGADGERRLMRAVLVDAIECYLKHMTTAVAKYRRLFHDTERWIFSRDVAWPFSFENICDALDLDPRPIRATLRERRRAVVGDRYMGPLPMPPRRRCIDTPTPVDVRSPAGMSTPEPRLDLRISNAVQRCMAGELERVAVPAAASGA